MNAGVESSVNKRVSSWRLPPTTEDSQDKDAEDTSVLSELERERDSALLSTYSRKVRFAAFSAAAPSCSDFKELGLELWDFVSKWWMYPCTSDCGADCEDWRRT